MASIGHAIQFVNGTAPVIAPAPAPVTAPVSAPAPVAAIPTAPAPAIADSVPIVSTVTAPAGIVAAPANIQAAPEAEKEVFILEAFRATFDKNIAYHAANTFVNRKTNKRYSIAHFNPTRDWALRGKFEEYLDYLTDPNHPIKAAKGQSWVGSRNSAKGQLMAILRTAYEEAVTAPETS